MHKIMACLAAGALALLSACSQVPNHKTNYVAPSVGKVRLAVTQAQDTTTQAQRRVTSAQTHAANTNTRLSAAAAKAKTAKEKMAVLAKAVEKQPDILSLAVQVDTELDMLTQELLGAQDENKQLQADLADTQKQLSDTQTSLSGAQQKANELQTEVTNQTNLLNKANADLNAAIIQGAKDKHNAHVFKWIIIGVSTAAVGLLIFGIFGALCFTPPLLYLTLAGPAAVGTFLFFFLG